MSVQCTDVNDFGYVLPTPDASEGERGPTKEYDPNAYSQGGRTLTTFAARHPENGMQHNKGGNAGYDCEWLTPTANENYHDPDKFNERMKKFKNGTSVPSLTNQVMANPVNFPTPSTHEFDHPDMEIDETGRRKPQKSGSTHSLNLADTVKLFPTPGASDYKGSGVNGKPRDRLDYACERGETKNKKFLTPSANEDAAGTSGGKMQKMLGNSPEIRDSGKGSLSPDWVESLMGWGISWSSIEPIKGELLWDFNWSHWEMDIPRVGVAIPDRAKRLKAIGNGQVPLCVAVAWLMLSE